MKYPVYAVRDAHVGFNAPMTDINDNTAKRGFALAINSGEVDMMHFRPQDYDLYKLAEFDSDTGRIESLDVPLLIVSGSSVSNSEVK